MKSELFSFCFVLPKEGSGAGWGFEDPPEVEDAIFFASTGSALLCFGPRAIKSPENPRGLDLEFLGGKFLPRSIFTNGPASTTLENETNLCLTFKTKKAWLHFFRRRLHCSKLAYK